MKVKINTPKMLAGLGILAIGVMLSDCTPMITEEQLAKIKELRKQEKSLNEDISKVQSEIPKLKQEINSREAELKDCNDKKDFITQKLQTWPDVWPDWKPEEAQPATPATPTETPKK